MTSDNYATSVAGPAALITAIPALLGFIPERSLVLITFEGDGDEIGTTMRHDLSLGVDGRPTPDMLGVIEHLARVCESYCVHRVIAVIIDDRFGHDAAVHRRLAAIRRSQSAGGGRAVRRLLDLGNRGGPDMDHVVGQQIRGIQCAGV